MAVQQIPAELPIELVRGDELSFVVRVNADLTGYTITAGVFNAAVTEWTPDDDEFAPDLEVDIETVTIGEEEVTRTDITVSFTEEHTEALSVRQSWRWYLRWVSPGNVTRAFVSGEVRSRNP